MHPTALCNSSSPHSSSQHAQLEQFVRKMHIWPELLRVSHLIQLRMKHYYSTYMANGGEWGKQQRGKGGRGKAAVRQFALNFDAFLMHADGSRTKQFETFHCNKYLNGRVGKEGLTRETQRVCDTHTHTHTLLLPESAISVRQNDNTEKCSKVSTTWRKGGKGKQRRRGDPEATRGQTCFMV